MSMKRNIGRIVGASTLLAMLSACGGSSGGSGLIPVDDGDVDSTADDTTTTPPASDPAAPATTVPSATVPSGTGASTTEPADSGGSVPTGDEPGEGDPPGPPPSPDTSILETSGRTAISLFAAGGTVVGVDGAALNEINGFTTNDNGDVAVFGNYTSGNRRFNAIWTGTPADLNLLDSTGSPVSGLPANEQYDATQMLSLASDGSLAQVITLTGPVQNNALVTHDDDGSRVVLETGDELEGLSAPLTLESIESIDHSRSGTAILGKTEFYSSSYALWLYQNQKLTAVAETLDNQVDSAPELNNICRVFLENTYYSLEARGRLLDSGAYVFSAYLQNYSTGPCVQGTALIRYQNGAYTSLVAQGDIVPNAPDSIFTDIRLIKVAADGTTLFYAVLQTPTGDARRPDREGSYWSVALDGSKKLIALDGEEIQVGDAVETFSLPANFDSTSLVDTSDSGYVGMLTDFGDDDKVTLIGGKAHNGQPHALITTPGASALNYLIDRTARLPAPFKGTEFFSTIGWPSVTEDGDLIFYGEISSSVLNAVTTKAIWQIDTTGTLTELVEEADEVTVGGIKRGLYELVQSGNSSGYRAGSGTVAVTNDGGIFFRADLESSYGSDVLVYLAPAN